MFAARVVLVPLSPEEGGGTKLRLSYLMRRLKEERGIDTEALWDRIQTLVAKSLVCVEDVIDFQVNQRRRG